MKISLEEEYPLSPSAFSRKHSLTVDGNDIHCCFCFVVVYERIDSDLLRFQLPSLPSSSFAATPSTLLSSLRATYRLHSQTVSVSSSGYKMCTTLDFSFVLPRKLTRLSLYLLCVPRIFVFAQDNFLTTSTTSKRTERFLSFYSSLSTRPRSVQSNRSAPILARLSSFLSLSSSSPSSSSVAWTFSTILPPLLSLLLPSSARSSRLPFPLPNSKTCFNRVRSWCAFDVHLVAFPSSRTTRFLSSRERSKARFFFFFFFFFFELRVFPAFLKVVVVVVF